MMKAGETPPPRGHSFIASAPSGGNKLPLIQWQPRLKSIRVHSVPVCRLQGPSNKKQWACWGVVELLANARRYLPQEHNGCLMKLSQLLLTLWYSLPSFYFISFARSPLIFLYFIVGEANDVLLCSFSAESHFCMNHPVLPATYQRAGCLI